MTSPRTFLDVHIIQTVPPSCVNRDDTGSPKTAVYGGVQRARVSSQAWKRSTRVDFGRTLDRSELGVRTKRVVEVVARAVTRIDPGLEERSTELAEVVLHVAGLTLSQPRKGGVPESGYLVFLSRAQVDALARAAVEAAWAGGSHEAAASLDKKLVQKAFRDQNSIDVALFGRMVADVTDLNVDAAAQIAHAISVHQVDNEFDYFTAVDDQKAASEEEDAGAAMIGTVEFNSSTMYRYATVDVDGLWENLGRDASATRRALETFLRSFVRSMPTGKQNTFANRTLPDAVVVTMRDDQPISYVGAFESPLTADGHGYVTGAVSRLTEFARQVDASFGSAPLSSWVVGVGAGTTALDAVGERVAFPEMVTAVGEAVAGRLLEDR